MTEFAREQHIIDLATKLQLGTATQAEQLEAANALSFTAGERIGLERKVIAYEYALAFFMRVMKIFRDIDLMEELTWKLSGEYAPFTFFVNCSDDFVSGTADTEPLTPENLAVLEQSITDVLIEDAGIDLNWALILFCARVRGRLPMAGIRIPDQLEAHFQAIVWQAVEGGPR